MKLRLCSQLLNATKSLIYASYSAMLITTALLIWAKVHDVSFYVLATIFIANLLLSLAHHYFFIRVQFDAKILDTFSQFSDDALDHHTQALDHALYELKLTPKQQEIKSWNTRIQGCYQLLKTQVMLLALQYLLCIFVFMWI